MGNLTQQEAQQLISGKLTRYFGVSAAEAHALITKLFGEAEKGEKR